MDGGGRALVKCLVVLEINNYLFTERVKVLPNSSSTCVGWAILCNLVFSLDWQISFKTRL